MGRLTPGGKTGDGQKKDLEKKGSDKTPSRWEPVV